MRTLLPRRAPSAATCLAALVGIAAATTGCSQLADELLGIDGGSAMPPSEDAATTGVSYPEGGTTEAVVGSNCGTEVTTGVVLCTGVSSCPDISVDQTALLGCGFRIDSAGSYDLECGCNGSLCPLGTPTTCAEASLLLANQTVAEVCVEVSEGHCTQPAAAIGTTGTSGTSTTTSTTSTCDPSCAATCVGAAPCLQLCGC